MPTLTPSVPSLRAYAALTRMQLYWLARMVYAGEDPRFIFRRMLILASEDVGLAGPEVVVINACAEAPWVYRKGVII